MRIPLSRSEESLRPAVRAVNRDAVKLRQLGNTCLISGENSRMDEDSRVTCGLFIEERKRSALVRLHAKDDSKPERRTI